MDIIECMTENATLLFDGDCGFCQTNVRRIDKLLNSDTTVLPYQKFDFSQTKVTRKDAESALVFIATDSEYYIGAAALSKWLMTGNTLYKVFGSIIAIPGFSQSAQILYKFIAKHKSLLSRSPHCTPASE